MKFGRALPEYRIPNIKSHNPHLTLMAYPLNYIVDRLEHFTSAWKTNAADTEFGGMSLKEFGEATGDSLRYRDEITKQEIRLKGLKVARDKADKVSMEKIDLVVNSVRGTPGFGRDSALYRALGYVRSSERKSGLVRKKS